MTQPQRVAFRGGGMDGRVALVDSPQRQNIWLNVDDGDGGRRREFYVRRADLVAFDPEDESTALPLFVFVDTHD